MGGYRETYAPGQLLPNDRTLPMLIASSGECHLRSFGEQGTVSIQRPRGPMPSASLDLEAERLGGLEVDHQLELGRSLEVNFVWLRCIQDLVT